MRFEITKHVGRVEPGRYYALTVHDRRLPEGRAVFRVPAALYPTKPDGRQDHERMKAVLEAVLERLNARSCEVCGRRRAYWTDEAVAQEWGVCGDPCRRRKLRDQRREAFPGDPLVNG